eukprot:3169187-Rhodomonas_salina.1
MSSLPLSLPPSLPFSLPHVLFWLCAWREREGGRERDAHTACSLSLSRTRAVVSVRRRAAVHRRAPVPHRQFPPMLYALLCPTVLTLLLRTTCLVLTRLCPTPRLVLTLPFPMPRFVLTALMSYAMSGTDAQYSTGLSVLAGVWNFGLQGIVYGP